MRLPVRFVKTVAYAAVGAFAAGLAATMFIAIWTAISVGVPLPHVWKYMRQVPAYGVFALGFICIATVAGLVAGVVKGLRK